MCCWIFVCSQTGNQNWNQQIPRTKRKWNSTLPVMQQMLWFEGETFKRSKGTTLREPSALERGSQVAEQKMHALDKRECLYRHKKCLASSKRKCPQMLPLGSKQESQWDAAQFIYLIFLGHLSGFSSVQFSSVAQSCPTLCDPMNHSMPGLPVHHQLPESTQTHVHRVGDAIQPSNPLLSPPPPAFNSSQHQGLFKWVSSLHQVARVLEFQL